MIKKKNRDAINYFVPQKPRHDYGLLSLCLFLLFFFCALSPAASNPVDSVSPSPQPNLFIPSTPHIKAKSYLLMDANSGTILAQKEGNLRLPPASLTKLMTLYVASEALSQNRIHLDDKTRVSKQAWSQSGARMFLKEGSFVSIAKLIEGIIVASGNDACVAIAQYIAGDESSFSQLMNQAAQSIGMKNSHFISSSGLPRPDHYSTAYDLALLAQAIINQFPQYYDWYRQKWITYNKIRQPNRNRLLWRDPSVDGLKTGHTDAAGYCLVASASRKGTRLISVVMGTTSDAARSDASQALLDWGFRYYKTHLLYPANTPLTQARVWLAQRKQVAVGLAKDFYVTVPIGALNSIKTHLNMHPGNLRAPLARGAVCGTLTITLNQKTIASAPLVLLQDDPATNWLFRSIDRIILLFKGG